MGKSKKVTIGYRYLMTLHQGLCRGPIDEVKEIEVGEKKLYPVDYEGFSDYGIVADGTVATKFDLDVLAHFLAVGTIIQVVGDPNPDFNGMYQKQSDGTMLKLSADGFLALSSNMTVQLNAPKLFGGDDGEGGIQGAFMLRMGGPTQTSAEHEQVSQFTGGFGALRGMVTAIFDGLICSMSPYPKPWRFRLRRTTSGWTNDECWYPAKATIWMNNGRVKAMNPAHILYEVLTNKEWGRGLSPSRIDENSFVYAANQLCGEGFGLCFAWQRQDDIDQFVKVVIDHIAGALYVDRSTGLYTLRLIRDDYDPEDLPLFDLNSGLLEIDEDENAAGDMLVNEVVVKYKDPVARGKAKAVRAQNLAAFLSHGSVLNNTVEYNGVPTGELAARLALRDLRIASIAPKRYKLVFDRRAWRLNRAMPIRISVPSRGFTNLVLRVLDIKEEGLADGKIEITATQDIFGLPATGYTAVVSSPYTPPSNSPTPAADALMFELGYRDIHRLGESVPDGSGGVAMVARKPANVLTSSFQLWTDAGGGYTEAATEAWTPNGELSAAITHYATSLTLLNVTDLPAVMTRALLIEGEGGFEIVRVDGYSAGVCTVVRGCADTLPMPHASGARAWFIDDYLAIDETEYADGELISGKPLTVAAAILPLNAASAETATVARRYERPYPPANLKANGLLVCAVTDLDGDTFQGVDTVLTWNERNRITQADTLVGHTEASVSPETAQTYTLRVYAADGSTLLRTEVGIAGATFTYDGTMYVADGSPDNVWMELEAVRDSLASMYAYRFNIPLIDHVLRNEAGGPISLEDDSGYLEIES